MTGSDASTYNGVMNKLQTNMVASAKASGFDTSSLLLEPLISSHIPWELAWVSFENEVLKNKLQLAMTSSTATNREKAKTATNNEMV